MRSLVLALALFALTQSPALAHRVNVFALVEGGEVVVECSYSKSKRVNNGSVEVLDLHSGAPLLTGTTDGNGLFRFPVPESAKASGLRIVLNAGEGHRNEWEMEASEFSANAATPEADHAAAAVQAPAPTAAPVDAASRGAVSGAASRRDVEEIVNEALDAKLAPIKRAVLERSGEGPGLREIVGGLGWIFGLVGVGAYFKSRSRV